MLPLAHISVQPSCQDCLAWSQDGELAIAAGEEIYLLIPQKDSPEPWTHLRITVSRFNAKEWPCQKQASFKDMSIGEEQARATVTALAWSPPGLAKHKRSVLAVLTSNLLLSLWASKSDPTDLDSWERVVVVNQALSSRSRLQQRIRSMAWTPTNPQHVDRQTPFSRKKWGIPIMAIADDANGLYILKISSPFAGPSFAWSVNVLRRDSVPEPNRSNDRPSLLSLAMNANHFVDRISFGMWDGGIPVAYRTSGIIHQAIMSVDEDSYTPVLPKGVSDYRPLTVSLDVTRRGDDKMPSQTKATPLIKARMATAKEDFGREKNMSSHVTLRTWGLASFNNLVAACISLHPAKVVEYTAPFEGNATILFDASNDSGNAQSIFHWQSPAEVDIAKTQQSVLDTILDQNLQSHLNLSNIDIRIIYTAICGNLLLSDDKRLQRIQVAVDALNLIERHANADLSLEKRALLSIKSSDQLSHHELIDIIGQMTKARGQAGSSSRTAEETLLDLCPFCSEAEGFIPFDSFTVAYCPQRHSFARCALTFLPILEPGTTKRCTDCKREFLDEQIHPGIHMRLSQRLGPLNNSDSNVEYVGATQKNKKRIKHSLASVLFDKFDTCPYCSGKFCG